MRLYDTAARETVLLDARGVVRLYVCGITPYDAAHIGHVATYLAFDVLRRVLIDQDQETLMVRNVTDIDDPLFERARRDGSDWKDLGDREVASFRSDMASLGLLPPDSEPRVTGAVDDIIDFIARLTHAGHTYHLDDRLYFSVDSYERFGEISGLSVDEMFPLARDNGGDVETPGKRNPLDFLLWQPSRDDEPSWSSPWGDGRPGWHIECSALADREFDGHILDIHGGGSDLIFPHHECESAQTRAATGHELSRIWMHVGLIGYQGEKMSKSKGNLVFARDLLAKYDPAVIRLAVAAHHYRSSWEWNDSLLDRASARLDLWRSASLRGSGTDEMGEASAIDPVRSVLANDLDTPAALELIDEAAARGKNAKAPAALMGIRI